MNDEITIALERRVIELTERVMALEAWKAEILNHAVSVMMTPPSKAERGQPIADTYPHIPLPDEKRMLKFYEMLHKDHYTINSPAMHIEAGPIRGKTNEALFVDEGMPTISEKEIAAMIHAELTPEEIEWMKRVVSDPPIPYPPKEWYDEPAQPEIDWEKVAGVLAVSAYPGTVWDYCSEAMKLEVAAHAQAAVAEYLRQVKEGGK